MFTHLYRHHEVRSMHTIFYLPDMVEAYCLDGVQSGKVPVRLHSKDFLKEAYESEAIYHYCEVYLKALTSFVGPISTWNFRTSTKESPEIRGGIKSPELASELFAAMVKHHEPSNRLPYETYIAKFSALYAHADMDSKSLRSRVNNLADNAVEWAKDIAILEEGTTANFDNAWLSFWVEALDYTLRDFSDWKKSQRLSKLMRPTAQNLLEEGSWLRLMWRLCLDVCPKPEHRQGLAGLVYSYFPHPKTHEYLSRRLDLKFETAPSGSLTIASDATEGAITMAQGKGGISIL